MAYHFDSYDQSLVIDGWQNGVADSPFSGIADMRNVNIVSVPGEASVNFSTVLNSTAAVTGTGTVTSANGGTHYFVYTGAAGLANGQAIVFAGGSLPAGITAGVIYWFKYDGTGNQIYSDFALNTQVLISGTGTGTFTVYNMSQPKYFTYDDINLSYWMVDSAGLVWSTNTIAGNGSFAGSVWRYTGNKINANSNGNGIVFYASSDSTGARIGYVFVFSNNSIDYTLSKVANVAWNYQWAWTAGTVGSYSNTPSNVLQTVAAVNNPHAALLAPDNVVYFCDANWIGVFYQTNPNVAFVPTTLSTYTPVQYSAILPSNDIAQCLTFLGTNILIGGKKNVIYPWNRTALVFNYPILLPEYNVTNMVTVNTGTYIFIGNRGRIYLTNGTNVKLYKKVPDHISGTIEPYYTWGGATSVKNQLYFSAYASQNGASDINQYGGVWAVDLDTDAIRLTSKLSYGTYAGYATALIPNFSTNPNGTGLYIGWDNRSSVYGIDTTSANPYSNSEATIDSDLIPIGTYTRPRDFTKVEYRLTVPLVASESITIKTRLIFNTQDTGYTTTLTDNTIGNYSNISDINFKNAQWVQFQIVLKSTTSNPSFVRLKDIRILGLTGPTLATSQTLSL